jgi:hypothetical protein
LHLLILSNLVGTKKSVLFKEIKQNIKNLFLSNKGEVGLKVFLEKFNVKYNSICKFMISIDNTKDKLTSEEYKIVLKRRFLMKEFIISIMKKKKNF